MRNKQNIPILFIALAAIVLAIMSWLPEQVSGRPRLGVTNFDSIHLRDTNATATPNFLADQRGTGAIAEFRDGGTPVARFPNGGGLAILSGPLNFTAQTETITTAWVITPTASYIVLSSTGEVTSSTTTGIVTTTATTGDIVILRNANAADAINVDGVGGTIECKANVALGASDTLTLIFNGLDWNCLANYDNS